MRLSRPLSSPPRSPSHAQGESELLATIARQANAGESAQARASCQRYLQQFAPKAQVFYWLGLLSDTEGDSQEAISQYRKALYRSRNMPRP